MGVRILHLLTKSEFFKFLEGQIRYLNRHGFASGLCSAPGKEIRAMAANEGAEVFEVPMEREIAPFRDFFSLVRLIGVMHRFRPEIVNAGTPKAGLLGMIAARLLRIPVRVYQVRGLRLETTSGLKRRILTATERIACRCATSVVCNSASVRTEMLRLRLVSAEKAVVLGRGSSKGVDSTRFQRTDAVLAAGRLFREEQKIGAQDFLIGFIGRLVADKGIRELCRAFQIIRKKYPSARLLLIGGEEKGSSPLDAETAEFIRTDSAVIRTGVVSGVENLLAACDLFLFPSYREGFPNVILEAEAMELPVVAFDVTGVRDALCDGVTGRLVPLKDAEQLAAAALAYLDDEPLRRHTGAAGRAFVETQFAPEAVFQRYADHYHKMKNEAR